MDETRYKDMRAQSKTLIQECFSKFLVDLQANIPNNIKIFWAYTKSRRKTNSYPTEFMDGDRTTADPTEICQMFSTYFQTTFTNLEANLANNTFSTENSRVKIRV